MRPRAIVPVTQDQRFIRMLVYGDPGVGKTVLAGTSPNCLILEADDGSESAAVQGSQASKWPMRDWRDMTDAYEYLRHEEHGYEWVWLDSITLFQERGLDNIMLDLVAAKPHRNLYVPDRGEYGENMSRMSMWTRNMKTLPFNFGITAHVMRVEDEDSKVTMMPAIQGRQMPDKVCAYMGIVAYMYTRRVKGVDERALVTRKRDKFYAKDRFDAFGGRVNNPTIPVMEAVIRKKLPEQSQPTKPSGARKKAVA